MRDLTVQLLEWYDHHARDMPWRIGPADRQAGVIPDPYRVWLSEVMLQQTTVAAVKDYFLRFTERWPDVTALARAQDADVMAEWAGLGYYARARNLLKCARMIADRHQGRFPRTREDLAGLPGIGPYTSAAIAAIAFDRPETVLDGNVERVMARLHAVHDPLPGSKETLRSLAADLTPDTRPGDYAQAVMDLGATICTPKSPACGICPWQRGCAARIAGIAARLPNKTPKKPKPNRLGIAYVVRREDGAWLLETRPDKGLLGGMLGWPGSEWSQAPQVAAPRGLGFVAISECARHTFTHFHLQLRIEIAQAPMTYQPESGHFVPPASFRPSDLPTVMRKVFDLARQEFDNDPSAHRSEKEPDL